MSGVVFEGMDSNLIKCVKPVERDYSLNVKGLGGIPDSVECIFL